MDAFDIVVAGAGIAGASLAAELASHARVLLLEAEDRPGYHTTGRSAAYWIGSYGGPAVQPLSMTSRAFMEAPPPGFADDALLAPVESLTIGEADDVPAIEALAANCRLQRIPVRTVAGPELSRLVPGLPESWTTGVAEEGCAYIDVAGLHSGYLRLARQRGAELRTRAALEAAEWTGGHWRLKAGGADVACATLVNAAGAWADGVAEMAGVAPKRIQPLRRTIVQLELGIELPEAMPLVHDAKASFYFKRSGRSEIWLSPQDETPDVPRDCAPEELDVAIAIDRFENAVGWPIRRVSGKWAGLRSFAPDRVPVFGYDPQAPRFFWFAGQGGFGIQTAAGAARLGAALLLGITPDPSVAGIDPAPFDPARFA